MVLLSGALARNLSRSAGKSKRGWLDDGEIDVLTTGPDGQERFHTWQRQLPD